MKIVSIARRGMELVSRGRVLKRRLPSFVGGATMCVSPDSQLKYICPGAKAFDMKLLEIARDYLKPGFNVWDLGANVGVFCFAAAGIVGQAGRVLAVEPDVWLANLLNRSKDPNSDRQFSITIIPAAVSNREGIADLRIAARGRASNALCGVAPGSMMGGVRGVQTVVTVTSDFLLRETFKPEFVKVDVEGAERLVLEGSGSLLKHVRPIFYVEVASHNSDAVTDVFSSHNYVLFNGDTRQPIDRCTLNTIAIPS